MDDAAGPAKAKEGEAVPKGLPKAKGKTKAAAQQRSMGTKTTPATGSAGTTAGESETRKAKTQRLREGHNSNRAT